MHSYTYGTFNVQPTNDHLPKTIHANTFDCNETYSHFTYSPSSSFFYTSWSQDPLVLLWIILCTFAQSNVHWICFIRFGSHTWSSYGALRCRRRRCRNHKERYQRLITIVRCMCFYLWTISPLGVCRFAAAALPQLSLLIHWLTKLESATWLASGPKSEWISQKSTSSIVPLLLLLFQFHSSTTAAPPKQAHTSFIYMLAFNLGTLMCALCRRRRRRRRLRRAHLYLSGTRQAILTQQGRDVVIRITSSGIETVKKSSSFRAFLSALTYEHKLILTPKIISNQKYLENFTSLATTPLLQIHLNSNSLQHTGNVALPNGNSN